MQKEIKTLSQKLAKAFNSNTLIAPLPAKFCKNTKNANIVDKPVNLSILSVLPLEPSMVKRYVIKPTTNTL